MEEVKGVEKGFAKQVADGLIRAIQFDVGDMPESNHRLRHGIKSG